MQSGVRLAFVGMIVNAVLAVAKVTAGLLGNSYVLIADGIESVLDSGLIEPEHALSHQRMRCAVFGPRRSFETLEGWQNGYCTSLENWRPQGLGGSNPSPSVGVTPLGESGAARRRSGLGTSDAVR